LKKSLSIIFQVGVVFIGTIVGAGLASGQEVCQFFTTYGYKSFIGIIICFFIYVVIGCMIIELSLRYKLNSYNDLICLVSPGFFGKITDILTGGFLISSAAIILAGSGALLKQYFGVSKWFGIVIMASISLFILLRNTKGLIEINSFIVPSLITVIIMIFVLYVMFYKNISVATVRSIPYYKSNWLISCLLYGGFNILCCSGVLVPLSREIKGVFSIKCGIILGAAGLTILSSIINLLLMLNIPYIFKYEIPLLYIAHRFGPIIQVMLLSIIWLEMFSTEVSDIYSVGKTVEQVLHIPYNKAVILILCAALPISQIGFVNLINILYPCFGIIGLIFTIQCIIFYVKKFRLNV
jgi:uncharacterized membrane protein YkvI